MTALEKRLRSALAGLAEETPPSHDAWAEQQRRLARPPRRSRRTPMLAAAAAAAVIVASVPATVVTQHAGPPASTTPDTSIGYDPSPDGPYLSITDGPVLLGEFDEAGRPWAAWVFVERHPEGAGWANRLCVVGVPAGAPVNGPVRHPNSEGCLPVPSWPHLISRFTSFVDTRSVLGGGTLYGGPLPNLLLFVTAPQARTLEAREAYGSPVPVKELGRTDELALFLADFGASAAGFGYRGFGYTARDAAGKVIDSGTT